MHRIAGRYRGSGRPHQPPALVLPSPCCLQFWSTARPDWYAVYAQRQLQQQGNGGGGAGAAGSWSPQAGSVTALLRRWDEARLALHASRRARQQRKEAWLLQRYGGGEAAGEAHCAHAGCRACETPEVAN